MLVITRKRHEELVIRVGADMVVVRVVAVGHGQVRIGVTAPKTVAVHREEVARRIAQEQNLEMPANRV